MSEQLKECTKLKSIHCEYRVLSNLCNAPSGIDCHYAEPLEDSDELERLQEEAEEEDDARRASEDAAAEAEAVILNDFLFKIDQLISVARVAEAMIKQRDLAFEHLKNRIEIEGGKSNVDSL